jgi:hypothetical protein
MLFRKTLGFFFVQIIGNKNILRGKLRNFQLLKHVVHFVTTGLSKANFFPKHKKGTGYPQRDTFGKLSICLDTTSVK